MVKKYIIGICSFISIVLSGCMESYGSPSLLSLDSQLLSSSPISIQTLTLSDLPIEAKNQCLRPQPNDPFPVTGKISLYMNEEGKLGGHIFSEEKEGGSKYPCVTHLATWEENAGFHIIPFKNTNTKCCLDSDWCTIDTTAYNLDGIVGSIRIYSGGIHDFFFRNNNLEFIDPVFPPSRLSYSAASPFSPNMEHRLYLGDNRYTLGDYNLFHHEFTAFPLTYQAREVVVSNTGLAMLRFVEHEPIEHSKIIIKNLTSGGEYDVPLLFPHATPANFSNNGKYALIKITPNITASNVDFMLVDLSDIMREPRYIETTPFLISNFCTPTVTNMGDILIGSGIHDNLYVGEYYFYIREEDKWYNLIPLLEAYGLDITHITSVQITSDEKYMWVQLDANGHTDTIGAKIFYPAGLNAYLKS